MEDEPTIRVVEVYPRLLLGLLLQGHELQQRSNRLWSRNAGLPALSHVVAAARNFQ